MIRKNSRRNLHWPLWLGLSLVPEALAKEVTACVIDEGQPNNGTYFNLPTATTKLRCEGFADKMRPSFIDLYRRGWRLIQVVAVDQRLATKQNTAPSPLVFFERLQAPEPESASSKKKKKTKKK